MRAREALLVVIIVGLAVPPFLGINTYALHVLNLAWIAAIAVLGLNIATGVTGQIVLGQAALMGVGAYATALAMTRMALPWWAALAAALAIAAIVGAAFGLVSTRIKGHYLAITTLALNEIFRIVLTNEVWLTGGPIGMREIPGPDLSALCCGLGADVDHQVYLPLLAVTIGVYAFAIRLLKTRLGREMRAVRDDETTAEAMGVNSFLTKTKAFVLCSVLGALAGGLYALSVGFISPNNFQISESIKLLLMAVIGGLGSIGGSLLGALVVTILPEALRGLETYYMAFFGAAVVVILLVAPRGLGVIGDWLTAPWLPLPARLERASVHQAPSTPFAAKVDIQTGAMPTIHESRTIASQSKPLLVARNVVKHFGGVNALNDVSFDVREGEIVGLIGPNGSGKSTFINACSGMFALAGGSISVDGASLAGRTPWTIHALGVARIFQNVRLWESMSVLDNVMVPCGGCGHRSDALAALANFGIEHLAQRQAGGLSFGQSRLVELARATVARPRILLLDEPAAGLRGGLVTELAETLKRLRSQGTTVLVVEHRIKLVMSMCDRVVVLNLGEKIAEGTPEEIQSDPQVIEAYLGERVEPGAHAAARGSATVGHGKIQPT